MKLKSCFRLFWQPMGILALAAVLFIQAGQAQAWNANYQICFPDVAHRDPAYPTSPPNIDGFVSGDLGWASCWRFRFNGENNGIPVPLAVVQAIKDSDNIYLSFEANFVTGVSSSDFIAIAIDPTGAAAERRLLVISPVTPSGVANPIPMKSWQGYPWTGLGSGAPAGTQVAASVSGPADNRSWLVELKIPRGAFGIPASGNFGMFLDVAPVIDDMYGEHPWPDKNSMGAPLPQMGSITNTPDPSNWGQATTAAGVCNGVYITSADISTNNNPPTKINLNALNTFHAITHNTSIDTNGNYVAANAIFATYSIANFGLPSNWIDIKGLPPTQNPTVPPTNIGPNSSADLTMQWKLTPTQQTDYAANPHQCIQVVLDSAGAQGTTTVFTNKSACLNMDFGYASTFSSKAVVDPRGWPKPPAGQRFHQLELRVTQQVDQLSRTDVLKSIRAAEVGGGTATPASERLKAKLPESMAAFKEFRYFPAVRDTNYKNFVNALAKPYANVSQLTTLVHGYRRTGKFIKNQGKAYEVADFVGSYGYVVRHAGIGGDGGKTKWPQARFQATRMEQIGGAGRYRIKVPIAQSVPVNVQIKAPTVDIR